MSYWGFKFFFFNKHEVLYFENSLDATALIIIQFIEKYGPFKTVYKQVKFIQSTF